MEACSRDLKKITLELGGKSPLIIFDDANLRNAVSTALNANFFSQGAVSYKCLATQFEMRVS